MKGGSKQARVKGARLVRTLYWFIARCRRRADGPTAEFGPLRPLDQSRKGTIERPQYAYDVTHTVDAASATEPARSPFAAGWR